MAYEKWHHGQWDYVRHGGMDIQCCDCGLVHRMKFKIEKIGKRNWIRVQVKRHPRATAAVRRAFRFEPDIAE
jgi:uncharacterized Zn finger protein